ncbi:hypothetical protein ABEB36_013025 [Hypothenemus hampei]|uniref:Uncharacterized protein n=1 Tax=Hypothenemus hampei TaxID=57062 RepID=A0ABD1E9A6_HYPHA
MNPPISKKFTNYTRSKIRTTLFINFEVNLKRQSSFSYYSLDARRGSASSKICKKDQRFRHLVRLLVSVAYLYSLVKTIDTIDSAIDSSPPLHVGAPRN